MADHCSLGPSVLGPILCQQPPRFQSPLQREGGVAYLHRQESGKTWFANAKNYCVGVKGGEECQGGNRILSSMATGEKDAH